MSANASPTSGSGMTKTIWQAIVVFWNGVTRSERNHYARQPSYYRRIMPPADPLPPVVVQYQSVSQMRPKGMNNGNEGAEYGPTLQDVRGDIAWLIKPLQDGGELKISISKKHSGILTLNTSKKRKKKKEKMGWCTGPEAVMIFNSICQTYR